MHDVEAVQEGYFHELSYLCASGPRLALRAVVESLAGNPSWNTGVDFAALFAALGPDAGAVVRTLYDRAGLNQAVPGILVLVLPQAADPLTGTLRSDYRDCAGSGTED